MEITATKELETLFRTARKFDVGSDQLERFIAHAYIPQPKQLEFHGIARQAQRANIRYIAQGGTRSSSKTHTALAQTGLDDCQRCPGLKVLFLRKIQEAAKESFGDVIQKVFAGMDYRGPGQDKFLHWPNGSRIRFGGYKDSQDIDKYLGIEYDLVVVEEATQLEEDKIDKIDGSLRTTRDDWKSCMYLTFNPEGIGLQWAKQRFVVPWRNGKEQDGRTRFVFSTYKDNKFTDPSYVEYLEGLKGPLGKAWRDGNFDTFMGQAFPHFSYDRHVVEPFDIPDYWKVWVGVDDGYAKPFCTLWLTIDPTPPNRIYVIEEAYQNMLTNTEQANLINDLSGDWRVREYLADPAMFSRSHRYKAESAADVYRKHGIRLKRGDNVRLQGKRRIDDLLGSAPDGLPKIQIFDHCKNLIDELTHLTFDDSKPEDVNTTQPDHAYDALRYATGPRRKADPEVTRRTKQALAAIGRL